MYERDIVVIDERNIVERTLLRTYERNIVVISNIYKC